MGQEELNSLLENSDVVSIALVLRLNSLSAQNLLWAKPYCKEKASLCLWRPLVDNRGLNISDSSQFPIFIQGTP